MLQEYALLNNCIVFYLYDLEQTMFTKVLRVMLINFRFSITYIYSEINSQ